MATSSISTPLLNVLVFGNIMVTSIGVEFEVSLCFWYVISLEYIMKLKDKMCLIIYYTLLGLH